MEYPEYHKAELECMAGVCESNALDQFGGLWVYDAGWLCG